MKRIAITICAAAFLFACNTEDKKVADTKSEEAKVASVSTDTPSEKKAWVPVDSATAMKKMWEMGTPGAQHAMLAKSNGGWDAEMTMWMAEGSAAQVTKAACTNKMIYDGRYQQSTFKGSFDKMPFEGTSITGYDNSEKMFFSTWMDNMSTGLMTMKGTWDEATKSINLKGKMVCPANGIECEMREVYKIVDDNTHIMEMYGPDMKTGKEFKGMEIKFTRKR
ncbi:MAG TPA: DUF1579 domain-containing protein [Flavisolibacter sp.]|jgi:hypothetical protein